LTSCQLDSHPVSLIDILSLDSHPVSLIDILSA
jgi:hypothetical protein